MADRRIGAASRRNRLLTVPIFLALAMVFLDIACAPAASSPPATAAVVTGTSGTAASAAPTATPAASPTGSASPTGTATAATSIAAPSATPTLTVTPWPTPLPPTATTGPSPLPSTPAAAITTADDALLILDTPVWNQAATGAVHVAGRARVFEAEFSVALVVDGAAQAPVHVMASAGAPAWGAFQVDLPLPAGLAGRRVAVRVFFASPRDGSEQRLAEVPVRVGHATPTVIPNVRVYFTQRSGAGVAYVPAPRPAGETPALGHVALEALLQGPDPAERAAGLTSPIPPGTTLRSLRIAGGLAAADFDGHLTGGVPTQAQALAFGAIELTLRQFPSVQTVTITVDGRPAPAPATGRP